MQWEREGGGIPLASRATERLAPILADWASGSCYVGQAPGSLARASGVQVGLHLLGTDGVREERGQASRLCLFPTQLWFAGSCVLGVKATSLHALGS